MKLFFCALVYLGFSGVVHAQTFSVDKCMDISGCSAGITVDTGNTGKSCGGSSSSCSCFGIANGCPSAVRTSCNYGETDMGPTILGKRCCVNSSFCRAEDVDAFEQEIEGREELSDVFNGQSGSFTTAHFGVVNNTNRSPNTGRGNSVYAKLDACLGHANVDADTDMRTCETACQNTLKNQYCQNNTAAVCIDRCECRWGEPGCNGL